MDTKKYTFELLKVKPMSGVNKRKESGFLDDVFEKTVKKYGLKNPIPKKKKGGLIGGQKKLDANKDGKISGEDFKILKGSRKGMRMGGSFVLTPEQKRKSKVAESELAEIEKRKRRRDAEQMMSNRNPAQMKMGGYAGSETSKRQGPSKLATPPKKGKMGMNRKKVRGN